MKRNLQIIVIASLILFNASLVFSQDESDEDNPLRPKAKTKPFFIGPTAGINSVFHSVNLHTFSDGKNVVNCPVFENGKSTGFYVGLNTEFLIGDVANSKSSVIVRFLYNSMPASFYHSGDTYPSVINNTTTQKIDTVYSTTEHKNEVKYNLLTLEAQYKLNLFQSPFGVVVGPTFDFALAKTQDQAMNLLQPNNAQFVVPAGEESKYSNSNRTYTAASGDIPSSSALRIGLKFGVQYEILGKNWILVPHVDYNLGITNLSTVQNWRVSVFQFGFDFRYGFKF